MLEEDLSGLVTESDDLGFEQPDLLGPPLEKPVDDVVDVDLLYGFHVHNKQ